MRRGGKIRCACQRVLHEPLRGWSQAENLDGNGDACECPLISE